jgi:hypothetical protein
MTDIKAIIDVHNQEQDTVESLRQQLAGVTKALNAAKLNIASTDKMREFEAIKYRQADEAIATLASEREANAILTQQLASYVKEDEIKANVNKLLVEQLAECQAELTKAKENDVCAYFHRRHQQEQYKDD